MDTSPVSLALKSVHLNVSAAENRLFMTNLSVLRTNSRPPSPSPSPSIFTNCGDNQALSDILAWGSSSSSSNDKRSVGDSWHLYQSKLLPELQAVARKHGRGFSPADVATAFHLYRKPFAPSTGGSDTDLGRRNDLGDPVIVVGNPSATVAAAAVSIPVRVNSAGSLSARRSADAEEDRIGGRRGAELAEMLDGDDLESIAAAVGEGETTARAAPATNLGWEEELLWGAEGEEEEGGELWGVGAGWEGATIFL